jgi:hypothetical protein
MDDFNITSLHDSKNEWCVRLINVLTPLVIEGVQSIFKEACTLCETNEEEDKYLMTFQNLISRIPKWNQVLIKEETDRIKTKSNCAYIEDLISCVHIIQLKTLACVRVGKEQKKIDIAIPSLEDFIHKTYINVARKLYTNVYLFEITIPSLEKQKLNREFEIVVKECIMNTIRDNIPVESLLRAYIDDTEETEVTEKEEITREIIEPPAVAAMPDAMPAMPAGYAMPAVAAMPAGYAMPAMPAAMPAMPAAMPAPQNEEINESKMLAENIVLDIKTEEAIEGPKITTTEKSNESQITINDPEEPKYDVPSLASLAQISSDLENNTNIKFNTIGEALDINGEKEKFNPLDQPERTTDYDADDDDDDDKLKIGDSISLNNITENLSLDVSDTSSLLDIEVLS